MKPHLTQAKPGRLLKLLTQAINWQKHMGVYRGGRCVKGAVSLSFTDTLHTLGATSYFGTFRNPVIALRISEV